MEGRCCVVTGLGNSVTSTGGNFKLNSLRFDGEWPGVCIWGLKSLMSEIDEIFKLKVEG